jgi:hypothetical protein
MDFQHLLVRYFGQDDIETIDPEHLAGGLERMRLDFGLEKDAGRRFGLWTLMFMLGDAPPLDIAFKTAQEQDAARNFMDMVDRLSGE